MKVLVLGGTGQVGTAVTVALRARGAAVSVLCRSQQSEARAEALGATPLSGDIASPQTWADGLLAFDVVIHAAATFDARMAGIDARLIRCLIAGMSRDGRLRKLIGTGGVWIYGDVPEPADERAPYAPPAAWAWTLTSVRRVLAAGSVAGLVIHPGNVVDEATGVPAILLTEAVDAGEVRVPAQPTAIWPLVGRHDIGELYACALDRGRAGETYIGVSDSGATLERIGARVAEVAGLPKVPVHWPLANWVDKYGDWASGYGLSQNLNSAKARLELGWTPDFTLR